MTGYSRIVDFAGREDVMQVLRDDGTHVLTGKLALGDEVEDVPDFTDPDGLAFRAWLTAGGVLGAAVPKPREAYGDDLITVLSDAELAAMSGGTLRDQRMLSAQRVPFRAADDIIVRLAAVMKIDPSAWFARLPV